MNSEQDCTKGGSISEGIFTLVPLPTKSAKGAIFSTFFGNETKVKIPSEIKQELLKCILVE